MSERVNLSAALLSQLAARPLAGMNQEAIEDERVRLFGGRSRASGGPLDTCGILMEMGIPSEVAGRMAVEIAEAARLYRREQGLEW